MRRFLAVLALLPMALWLWIDPYTHVVGAGDGFEPAPLWQLAVAVVDATLLIAIGALLLRSRNHSAVLLLLIETVWSLASSIVLVGINGLGRFTVGFGSSETLTVYLGTILARILLIAWLGRNLVQSQSLVRELSSGGHTN